jgi:hypothetical protein
MTRGLANHGRTLREYEVVEEACGPKESKPACGGARDMKHSKFRRDEIVSKVTEAWCKNHRLEPRVRSESAP